MDAAWIWGLTGGLMIGCAGALFLLGAGRIMGVSGLVGEILTGACRWRENVAFLVGLVGVPMLLNLALPVDTHLTTAPVLLIAGGLLVGLGTRLGSGCTSGHGVCGMSRLSLRSIVATAVYIAAGMVSVAALRLVWIGG